MAVLANIGESCWSVISLARPADCTGGFSDSVGRVPPPSSVSIEAVGNEALLRVAGFSSWLVPSRLWIMRRSARLGLQAREG